MQIFLLPKIPFEFFATQISWSLSLGWLHTYVHTYIDKTNYVHMYVQWILEKL